MSFLIFTAEEASYITGIGTCGTQFRIGCEPLAVDGDPATRDPEGRFFCSAALLAEAQGLYAPHLMALAQAKAAAEAMTVAQAAAEILAREPVASVTRYIPPED